MDKKHTCNSRTNNAFKLAFATLNFVPKILSKNSLLLTKKMIYRLFSISIYHIGYVSLKVSFNLTTRKYTQNA